MPSASVSDSHSLPSGRFKKDSQPTWHLKFRVFATTSRIPVLTLGLEGMPS